MMGRSHNPIVRGEFMLFLEGEVLVAEEHYTSLHATVSKEISEQSCHSNLCDQQRQLVLLGIGELTQLDAHELGSNVRRQVSDGLRGT